MKRLMVLIGLLAVIIVVIYLSLPFFVFQSYEINGLDESYAAMVDKLGVVKKQYGIPLDDIKGGEKYSFKFVKGMDHVCVIRVDRASQAIINIEKKFRPSDKSYVDGSYMFDIPWLYNDASPGLKQFVIDQFNYFVVDHSQMILWYVGYSV